MSDLQMITGFGNEFATEAMPGTLPKGQNSPQEVAHGLYAEQLTGSAFTMPRGQNLRSWLYRIQPTVKQSAYEKRPENQLASSPLAPQHAPEQLGDPSQMRWSPTEFPKADVDFVDSLTTMVVNGNTAGQSGIAAHHYACAVSMSKTNKTFYSADGEFLIVPESGRLELKTEFGNLEIGPLEIAVIPKGIKFQVNLPDGRARGYVCENYGAPFKLPDLGPIGANGLANPRDFEYPVAAFEDVRDTHQNYAKYGGQMWSYESDGSPFDVVAWHGNYAPYKYDLRNFNTMNTVSFDHPDPSIFTVLTAPSVTPGMANCDFVIFPPRWMVAENTFRPPYYHRNIMSEYMGLITGGYDAKGDDFAPGGASLHNAFSAHGPDASAFQGGSDQNLEPERYKDTMAFMFESRYPFQPTKHAMTTNARDANYMDCWQGLKRMFSR